MKLLNNLVSNSLTKLIRFLGKIFKKRMAITWAHFKNKENVLFLWPTLLYSSCSFAESSTLPHLTPTPFPFTLILSRRDIPPFLYHCTEIRFAFTLPCNLCQMVSLVLGFLQHLWLRGIAFVSFQSTLLLTTSTSGSLSWKNFFWEAPRCLELHGNLLFCLLLANVQCSCYTQAPPHKSKQLVKRKTLCLAFSQFS